MEKKIAVYICTGCGIGDALDMGKLEQVAAEESNVLFYKKHSHLCGREAAVLLKSDMDTSGINTLVIAACSPRVMFDVFNFDNCIIDRVNLREQVAWCQQPGETDTQLMAEDYLRMSLAKVKAMELPEPFQPEEELSKDILVVGGGVTGMTSALEVSRAGYSVVLVEKKDHLGGFQERVKAIATFPYQGLQDNGIQTLIQNVSQDERIKVYTGAQIEKTSGGPGLFQVSIRQNGAVLDHRVGAIVMAAGWKPYDPEKLNKSLGFGTSPNVITNTMFEELTDNGIIVRPSDGQVVKNVAFLQCAGQRDSDYLPYCSTVCCTAALKQALEVKAQDAASNVFVVYKELRTPGQAEDLYRKAQEAGIIFIRCQSPEVKNNGSLSVEAYDELLSETVVLNDLDLVVLATGMVPVSAFGDNIVQEQDKGEERISVTQEMSGDVIRRSNILNLDYRQGPEIPALKYDFPDSHFICFPYESRRTGIYAAGCVRRPMGIAAATEDAAGAAMKAIQCIELTSRGAAVHPRAGDLSYPEFAMQRCTQCKRCTVECPFGAINEDAESNPLPQRTRCRRCGVCMGSCPERIISFKNYSVAMISGMIKAINVPEDDERKPRILVFACENDAYPALDMAGINRMTYNAWVRIIPLRCLGSMNVVWIADSLSRGIDGVFLLGCKHGDDYQCHFIKGSELATIRLGKVAETLERLALESERVRFETVSIIDYKNLPSMLDDFGATIDRIGPNPFKGW